VGRTRSVNHRSTRQFLKLLDAGQSGVAEREWLDDQALARDRFVFGLRRLEGIVWSEFQKACPTPLCESIERLVEKHAQAGWLERHEDRLRLTESGLVISDALWPAYYQVGVG
jgi:coproporphyrinogen III oxidase-like Fe-S oxidoreductase